MNRIRKSVSTILLAASLLASAAAQDRSQQKASQNKATTPAAAAPQGGTPGRIAKFTDTRFVGDSNITEDNSGKVGIGTTIPTSMLTVNGFVEMMGAQGGLKFPDGTTQTTAGLAKVISDGTLKGDGTPSSRLGVQVPLHLSYSSSLGTTLTVSNPAENGFGIWAFGGPKGVAV